MPKITEMFAFVIADRDENDEGVMGAQLGGTMYPLVGADRTRLKTFKKIADMMVELKKAHGPYRILHFTLDGEIDPREI